MRRLQLAVIAMFVATACGGGESSDTTTGSGSGSGEPTAGQEQTAGGGGGGGGGAAGDEFQLSESDDAEQAHGDHPSEIEATRTHAAMRLFVVDPDNGPIQGIVIKMTDPNGRPYYTDETDSVGYAEVLVPAGQRYRIEYLSLGRQRTTANVEVPEGPNQDIRLTMRYRGWHPIVLPPDEEPPAEEPEPEGFVLEGVLFESGSATIQEQSHERLDRVVEYMTYRRSARIRIAGHTDNVGNPQRNQQLSEQRAQSVRQYLIDHGIDADRVEAVGYGDAQPVAPNDTDEGRAQNRRIEAMEI